jgi:hypothetical protein
VIEDSGFGAEALQPGSVSSPQASVNEELASWRRQLTHSLMFTVPVFFLAMVLPVVPGTDGFRMVSACSEGEARWSWGASGG